LRSTHLFDPANKRRPDAWSSSRLLPAGSDTVASFPTPRGSRSGSRRGIAANETLSWFKVKQPD
jgi:hypothetical protein